MAKYEIQYSISFVVIQHVMGETHE